MIIILLTRNTILHTCTFMLLLVADPGVEAHQSAISDFGLRARDVHKPLRHNRGTGVRVWTFVLLQNRKFRAKLS